MSARMGTMPGKILIGVLCGVLSLWTANLALLQLSGTRELASGAAIGPDTLAVAQGVSGLVAGLALVVGTVLTVSRRRREGRVVLIVASAVALVVGYVVGLVFLLYSLLVYRKTEGIGE